MALVFTSSSTTHHLALVLLLMVAVFSPLCFAKLCHVDDEAGLLAFKSGITHDPSGLLSTWIPGTDCCYWHNVNCSPEDRVSDLSLNGDPTNPKGSLIGTISPSLFIKVRRLSVIFFGGHPNITGTLPKEIFNLPRLRILAIRDTSLSGLLRIDEGRKSEFLSTLILTGNQFTGSIPNSIFQFTSLMDLDLKHNKFSGGIPNGILRLRKLTQLRVEGNQLSGKIPDIFKSFALKDLDLSNNKLSGGIPPSFSSLAPQLQFFKASHNALTGRIPAYLSNFKQLSYLDLSYNRLSGPIPTTKFKYPAESFVGNVGLCGSPLPPCKKY